MRDPAKPRSAPDPAGVEPRAAGERPDEEKPAAEPAEAPTPDLEEPRHAQAERPVEEPAHPGVPLAPPGIVPESDVRVHSPAAAQPPHHLEPDVENLGELPWMYGDGRLVTLLRDPRTIFVYWDLSPHHVEQAFENLGPARAVLKVWNGSGVLREIEVRLEARGWYVRELPPGIDLRIELWALGERGMRLIRAARAVRMPPAEPSSVWEEIYLSLLPDQRLGRRQASVGKPLQWRAGQPPPPVTAEEKRATSSAAPRKDRE